ncbi:MAG: hypothetical protein OXS35_00065 [Dehalococcoidia bacterium]|nr:hypothetical protein [Dehalococcoidia bacterium]
MTMTNDRWEGDPPLVIVRDGQAVYPESQELAQRYLAVNEVWAVYWQTGDRQALVNLGIMPAEAT